MAALSGGGWGDAERCLFVTLHFRISNSVCHIDAMSDADVFDRP